MDEGSFYAESQQFLIDAWKDIEFKLFLESLALNTDIIKPSQVTGILMHHTWVCQRRHYFDESKEILATERELKLGIKSPLMVMEADGLDPDEVMRSWKLYEDMCKNYDISFNVKGDSQSDEKLAAEDQDYNDEDVQEDALNKARD